MGAIAIFRSRQLPNCCKQAISLFENWPVVSERNRDITSTIANVSTLPVSGRGEVLKQLNLQQKHEISGLYIWGSDTHISHPLDVSYGRICCIYICRPHGQPSVGTHGRICNKGNALCLSSPCPPLRSVWRADRTHSQGSRSGAGTFTHVYLVRPVGLIV
jgi:hypothetical protein